MTAELSPQRQPVRATNQQKHQYTTHQHKQCLEGKHIPQAHQNGQFPQLSRKFVARRISEGETGRLKEELKCQACGKGYKHVSSLAKHLWEHTPEWTMTSKLLISKHQQVQLLEAASILVSMNEDDEVDMLADAALMPNVNPASVPSNGLSANEAPTNTSVVSSQRETLAPGVASPESDNDNVKCETPESSVYSDHGSDSVEIATDSSDMTPAWEIPPKHMKSPKNHPYHPYYHHRRLSTNAGSLGSLSGSLGGSLCASLGRQASPLPEALLAKDLALHPPYRRRRRSTLHTSSVHRDTFEDDDGLQDPKDGERSPTKNKEHKNDGVFGDLEV